MRKRLLAMVLAAGGLLGACDGEPEDDEVARSCEAAAAEVERCFGPEAAEALLGSCEDQAQAEALMGHSCRDLAIVMRDEKADRPYDEAVREAVLAALREAITVGLTEALKQIFAAIPGDVAPWASYLILEGADDEADAEALAEDWADALRQHPGFAPVARNAGGNWYVVHAPCLIDLADTLPALVAELATGRSDTVAALGGTIERDGEDLRVSLPLSILPVDRASARDPLCAAR